MEKISIKIDDQNISIQKEATILEAALANNIYIPHLCYHPDLKPAGSCRLCLVEMDNGKIVTSCRLPVKEGMVLRTKSPELDKVRRPIVEMIIANHHMDCKNCPKKGQCKLQRIMAFMKIDKNRIRRLCLPDKEIPIDNSNPFFYRDHNKCVLCGICIRTCQEIVGMSAIEFAGRGINTKIATFGDKPIAESNCISCGECVVRCPVGALVIKNFRRPVSEIKSVCPYCSLGCGIILGIRDNTIVSVKGDNESPVNNGLLCVKGRFGLGFVHSPDRLTSPLIRIATPSLTLPPRGGGHGWGGHFREASWDEALTFIADKLKNYKGEQFAFIASTKCTNEDNYIAQKFARVVMDSNNIDTSVRLNDAPSVAAMIKATGKNLHAILRKSGRETFLSKIEKDSCILVAGDITQSHPIASTMVKKAVGNGKRFIVISHREIDLCRISDIWLKPYPGTEVALLMGMCKAIFDEDLLDKTFIEEHCDNFEAFKGSLEEFPSGKVERITGVTRDIIEEAARIYATSKPAAILWSSEFTQYSHGTDNVFGLLNLSMITGNINSPSGLIPLFSQNNSLGAFVTGCVPDFHPGCKTFNSGTGLTITEMPEAIINGKIKTLYIMGSDPASDLIQNQKKVKNALEKAEFIVLQDIFFNETAEFAHIILPAKSFAEKDGTFTNTEGKVQKVNKAVEPGGEIRDDWAVICELARKMGYEGFNFRNSEEITNEISSVLSKQYTDESYVSNEKDKYRLTPLQYKPSSEVSDIDYPLILTIEHDIYKDGSSAKRVEGLNILRSKEVVYLNPKDASDFGIKDGEGVRILSRWGEIESRAKLTNSSPCGVVFTYMQEEKINQLINPALDPIAKTPEIKICAIRVEPLG